MVMPVPVMPPMPVAIMADATRAVIGPDHAAAAIGIIVGAVRRIVVRAVEVAMVMMEVRPMSEAAVIAAVPYAAAVMECRTGSEAAAVETSAAAVESSTAKTTSTDMDCS